MAKIETFEAAYENKKGIANDGREVINRSRRGPFKPCHYFDYIVGTSYGGQVYSN
jgi:hypothetical protein